MRAEAQQRRRTRKGQAELFAAPVMHRANYYLAPKTRHTLHARDVLSTTLQQRRRIGYDLAWVAVLSSR